MRHAQWALWILVAMLGVAVPRAEAAGPKGAQALVDRGTELFKSGRYAEALEQFELAYADSGEGGLQYVIGRCNEELGRLEAAVIAYERFLGKEAPAEAKAKAEAAVLLLRERLSRGRLIVQVTPAGAEVALDGRRVGVSPIGPQEVSAGPHVVFARAAGREDGRTEVDVPGGGEAAVALELVVKARRPAATPVLPPVEEPNKWPVVDAHPSSSPDGALSAWGWATLGTGVALVAGGALSYGLGEADHRAITDTAGYGTPGVTDMTRQQALDLETDGYTKKTVGYVLWGVGGAALVTSVVLLVVDDDAEPAIGLGAAPAPGGAMVGAMGRF